MPMCRPVSLAVLLLAFWRCASVQQRALGVQSRHGGSSYHDTQNPFGSLLTAFGLGDQKHQKVTDATEAHDKATPETESHIETLSGDEAAMEELKATVRAAASAAKKEDHAGKQVESDEEHVQTKTTSAFAAVEEMAEANKKKTQSETSTSTSVKTHAGTQSRRMKPEAQVNLGKPEEAVDEPRVSAASEILVARDANLMAVAPALKAIEAVETIEEGTTAVKAQGNTSQSTPDEVNSHLPMHFSTLVRPHAHMHMHGPRRPHRRHRQHPEDGQDGQDDEEEQEEHDRVADPAPEPSRSQVVAEAVSTKPRREVHHLRSKPEPVVKITCDNSTPDCTRSMCRWLKLSSKDTPGRCSLFEAQLRSCSYSLPETRLQGAPEEPLDCAINILRRSSVTAEAVADNVAELLNCITRVPPKINATCYVALGLLRTEVTDWKEEVALKGSVDVLREELKVASDKGRLALQAEEKEEEAISELTEVLGRAEPLPGHYLVDGVREARGVLDRLAPIPAVRSELIDAANDAKHAFETTSLWRVKQAIVWLGVSVGKAGRYGLKGPAAKGKKALQDLQVLKHALLDLKHAKFQANVSVGTKSGVPESLEMLNASIHRAVEAGLENGMPTARSLLRRLQALRDTVQAAADATATADEILAVGGNKGERSLASAVVALNASLAQAAVLELRDNVTVSSARAAYDKVLYILGARHALQKAERGGRLVLETNGSVLSDDSEEEAIDIIEPAIAWGTDVGLLNGLDAAQAAADQLLAVERAKENMTFALATGNASLKVKAGVSAAIGFLEAAIAGSLQANTSAGITVAQKQLKKLRAIQDAQVALDEAAAEADDAMTSHSGYREAERMLNASVHGADLVGLDREAAIANSQLRHLRSFEQAELSLSRSLRKRAPTRRKPRRVRVEDPGPNVTFNRFGLKVVDLPQVANGRDDGDDDFEEHIKVLAGGIKESKRKEEIDPQMEAQYENAVGRQGAYALLEAAIVTGEAAMESKKNVEASVAELTTSVREARERQLELDVKKGADLLSNLQKIPPALEKIRGAMLAVNVSMRTQTGMDKALTDIMSAIQLNKQLDLPRYVPQADRLRQALLKIKQAYVQLKAAIMQGQISLKNEDGEEAAIAELGRAIAIARDVGLTRLVEDAQELHDELRHMNTQHNSLQVAMNPSQVRAQ